MGEHLSFNPEAEGKKSLLERLRGHSEAIALFVGLAFAGQVAAEHLGQPDVVGGVNASTESTITPEQAKELLVKSKDIRVESFHDRIVMTVGDGQGEQVIYHLPGRIESVTFSVPQEWYGRKYEKGPRPTSEGEIEAEGSNSKLIDDVMADYSILGLSADQVLSKVCIETGGHSSSEGTLVQNEEASWARAGRVAADSRDFIVDSYGVAPEKVEVIVKGEGAEGNLEDFITALEEAGARLSGDKTKAAERIIKRCNDGEMTDPIVLKIFEETIKSHRRVDGTVTIEGKPVDLKISKKKTGGLKLFVDKNFRLPPGVVFLPILEPIQPGRARAAKPDARGFVPGQQVQGRLKNTPRTAVGESYSGGGGAARGHASRKVQRQGTGR